MRTVLRAVRAVSAAGVLAGAGSAGAVDIYATNHMYPGNSPDTLIRFDAADPAGFVTLGPLTTTENYGFGGLDFDGQGRLWAYATFNKFTGGATSGLYRVDTATGAATLQGMRSPQTLTDLSYNPANGTMYGVFTQGLQTSRLYTVNLDSGAVAFAGAFSGLPASHNVVGLGIDSAGAIYLFDNYNKTVYRADTSLAVTPVYVFELVFVGSQGITVDWANGDLGYHAGVGQGTFPNYFSQLNTFDLGGAGYTWGPDFGANMPDGLPPVQAGDLAIAPAAPPAGCYANCDSSTATPALNVADFTCFLQRFAAGESYANCDGSAVVPVLNVADFTCFLQRFAAGCP